MKRLMIAAAATIIVSFAVAPAFADEMKCDEAGMKYMFEDLNKETEHNNLVVTAYKEAVAAMEAMAAKDMAKCVEHMHNAMSRKKS